MLRTTLLALILLVSAIAAGASQRVQAATAPCGTRSTTTYTHVVVIVLENHGYNSIIGKSAAPYINSLAKQCGLATSYFAITHPSLPNYLAMTGGTTASVADDKLPSAHPLGNASILSQEGSSWRAFEESMPSNCYPKNSGDGLYVVRHNPAAYYTNIRTACQSQDVPLPASLSFAAAYTMVNPNLCHVMSKCSVTDGDNWLNSFVPKVLAAPEYQNGNLALFVTWDEGGGKTGTNQVANIVVAPTVPPGTRSSTKFNHYSMLLTQQQLLGKPCLASACSATSMRSAFHL